MFQRLGAFCEEPCPQLTPLAPTAPPLTSGSWLHGATLPRAGTLIAWRLLKINSASESLGNCVDFLANCFAGCVGICFVLPNTSY